MAKKNNLQNRTVPPKSSPETNNTETQPSEVAGLIGKVKQLLQEQCPEKALEDIARSKVASPWITNATGVCLLRIGDAKQAARVFQGLVSYSGVLLKRDAPLVFKTNYATALLASDNMEGGLSALHEIGNKDNPTVQKLHSAIHQWKQNLSFWQKLKWYTGDYPQKPVVLDFPLGELE
jgi:hypothetical protein